MTTRSVAAWALALLSLTAGGCESEPSATRTAPVGGERLLPAAESTAVVLGDVADVDAVDRHGYTANLDVVRVLRDGLVAGPSVRLAWEELAKSRPPRFREGDRILLALEPLPNGSLWDKRFPGGRAAGGVLAVAAKGEAYLRHPVDDDVDLLSAYLSLPGQKRQTEDGLTILAKMVQVASPGLAASALDRIESTDKVAAHLDAVAVRALEEALLDASRPLSLRRDLLTVVADRKLVMLRPLLDRLTSDSSMRAEALTTIATLDGGFEPQRIAELLNDSAPELRAVGARFARSPADRVRLAELIAGDPSPQVRAAAATGLIAIAGIEGFEEVVPALADSDSAVRLAAAAAVSRLGDPAVAPLATLVRNGTREQATGAILALDEIGGAGKPVLIEAATQHSDEHVRRLARLALGQLPGHEH